MGRSRKVDRQALLDAAETMLHDHGAARLTIEALAERMGVGKATVLYAFKSKRALMRALLERLLEAETNRLDAIRAGMSATENAAILSWIHAAERPVSHRERNMAMAMVAELTGDPELNELSRRFIRQHMGDATESAVEPRGALLAFLAVEGLKMLDYFGLHPWQRSQIEAICRDIAWLAEQSPDARERPSAPSRQPEGRQTHAKAF